MQDSPLAQNVLNRISFDFCGILHQKSRLTRMLSGCFLFVIRNGVEGGLWRECAFDWPKWGSLAKVYCKHFALPGRPTFECKSSKTMGGFRFPPMPPLNDHRGLLPPLGFPCFALGFCWWKLKRCAFFYCTTTSDLAICATGFFRCRI